MSRLYRVTRNTREMANRHLQCEKGEIFEINEIIYNVHRKSQYLLWFMQRSKKVLTRASTIFDRSRKSVSFNSIQKLCILQT